MSRPTKFEDLSLHDQQGPKVASFDPSLFLSLPRKALIRTLKALESLDACAADGLLDKDGSIDDGGAIVYTLRPTAADRKRKLRSAQDSWDRHKELYGQALTSPSSVPSYMRWSVGDWAKTEGKPAIQWPDADEAAED